MNNLKLGVRVCFHLATHYAHNPQSSKYKDTAEAAIAGVRSIADACIRSRTVKRLIYTASILSVSPRNDNGVGFRPLYDESCWTPLDVPSTYGFSYNLDYVKSKTLAEKAALSYNDFDDGKLEVVTLPCAVVGGESLLSYLPGSAAAILSQLTADLCLLQCLKICPRIHGISSSGAR